MENRVIDAVVAAGAAMPAHPNDPRTQLGSPAELRGIPAIGRNCPGAIPNTRPDHAVK
jgi:hypothetical protein